MIVFPKVSVIIPVYNAESTITRAIQSVPEGLEILVVNDGSTDESSAKAQEALNEYKGDGYLMDYGENQGVASAVNHGLNVASGEYVVLLGSDDYFYTDVFKQALKELDGTDLVYFNLQIDNGSIWRLNEKTKRGLCGSVKFMRRKFIGDLRNDVSLRAKEDLKFYNDLLVKNPTEKFTDLVVKHYTYPRKGSLTDLSKKGVI